MKNDEFPVCRGDYDADNDDDDDAEDRFVSVNGGSMKRARSCKAPAPHPPYSVLALLSLR